MKIVFLGTPDFAVPSLKGLLESHYHIAAVITQPDRPAGRGQQLATPPVKRLAAAYKVPVFQPEKIRGNPEALQLLQRVQPDLNVVVAFGQILPREFFAFPPLGTLNVHASLLPFYRGADPVTHTILRGETETGVTIMRIDEGMDTGDILAQRHVPIGENMTAGELEVILSEEGAQLLVETIPHYASGEISPVPQDSHRASYAPRVKKEDAQIDWRRSAQEVHNHVRAYNPWPGAFTSFRSITVKIWRSEKLSDHSGSSGTPGKVLDISPKGILVQCGSGSLMLKELQMPSRSRIGAHDFANGVDLKTGEFFS
ncbi:MAG: methionyl-tRNA formyltransferase [Acidobacteria bacterium]|nr:methionyl-tRNA formyltransferase [Acidobacteriota bacterium]